MLKLGSGGEIVKAGFSGPFLGTAAALSLHPFLPHSLQRTVSPALQKCLSVKASGKTIQVEHLIKAPLETITGASFWQVASYAGCRAQGKNMKCGSG